MKYYLERREQYFHSAGGEVDNGGVWVAYISSEELDGFEPVDGEFYNEDLEPINEDDEHGSEDGYNDEENQYEYKEVSKEQYDKYKTVISNYNKLNKQF